MWIWISIVLGVLGAVSAAVAGGFAYVGRLREDPEDEGTFITKYDHAPFIWTLISSALVAFSVVASGIASLTL